MMRSSGSWTCIWLPPLLTPSMPTKAVRRQASAAAQQGLGSNAEREDAVRGLDHGRDSFIGVNQALARPFSRASGSVEASPSSFASTPSVGVNGRQERMLTIPDKLQPPAMASIQARARAIQRRLRPKSNDSSVAIRESRWSSTLPKTSAANFGLLRAALRTARWRVSTTRRTSTTGAPQTLTTSMLQPSPGSPLVQIELSRD